MALPKSVQNRPRVVFTPTREFMGKLILFWVGISCFGGLILAVALARSSGPGAGWAVFGAAFAVPAVCVGVLPERGTRRAYVKEGRKPGRSALASVAAAAAAVVGGVVARGTEDVVPRGVQLAIGLALWGAFSGLLLLNVRRYRRDNPRPRDLRDNRP